MRAGLPPPGKQAGGGAGGGTGGGAGGRPHEQLAGYLRERKRSGLHAARLAERRAARRPAGRDLDVVLGWRGTRAARESGRSFSGSSHILLSPDAGCRRQSFWPLMSSQYRACSCPPAPALSSLLPPTVETGGHAGMQAGSRESLYPRVPHRRLAKKVVAVKSLGGCQLHRLGRGFL